MASILQFIWPLPDKGLSKRLYRLDGADAAGVGRCRTSWCTRPTARTSPPPSPTPALEIVDGAGHLPQLEQAEQTIG